MYARRSKIFLFILIAILSLPSLTSTGTAQESSEKVENVKYTLMVYVMNYITNSPEPSIKISMIMTNVTLKGLTDDFGCLKYSFNASKDLANNLVLNEISLYGNLTLIKIQDYMMEDLQYDSSYLENVVTYTGLEVRPRVVRSEKETLLYYYLYSLPGKFVNVSDLDISTMEILPSGELRIWGFGRRKFALDAKPAVPVNRELNMYESLYLFPLNYQVNIKVRVYRYRYLTEEYSVKATVTENVSYVNVMGPILDVKINETLRPLEEKVSSLKSLGLPMIDEERLLVRISNQKDNILRLVENRSYDAALTQLRFLAKKIAELRTSLSNLEASLTFSSIMVIAFIYVFSSLVPTLITDDSRRKFMLKFALYFSLFMIFLFAHYEFKIALSVISSSILFTNIQYLDNFTVLLIGLTLGSLGILIPTLISLYSPPVVSLSLDLSMRDFKRHLMRSVLTILAFSLIIASVLAAFKMSYSHILSETENRASFNRAVVCMQSTPNNIMVKSDLLFLKSMSWINSSYLVKSLYDSISLDSISGFTAVRLISPSYGLLNQRFEILGADPEFLDESFNFSLAVTKGGYLSENESAILVPASLSYYLRLSDRVRVRFVVVSMVGNNLVDIAEYDFGDFIVKGFFDPDYVSDIALPDGSPLIDSPYKTIIVPEAVLPDSIDARLLKITIPRLRAVVSLEELQQIDILKVKHIFLIPNRGIDVYEKAKELIDLTGYRTFGFSNGLCKTYEELYILNIVGISSIIPPVTIVVLIIALAMNSIIYERRKEIWALAVVGGNPRAITNMFLMEAITTGLLSTVVGYLVYTGVYLSSGLFIPLLQGWKPELVKLFTEMKATSGFDLSSILIVLLIGLVVPVIGSYVPCIKAQGLTLLGRSPRRDVGSDIRRREEVAEYHLPIRATPLDGEILYNYLKDNFFSRTFRVKKLSGNVYQDGTFDFKFTLQFRNVLTECALRAVRRGDTIYPVLTFPSEYSDAMDLHKFVYDLEKVSLNYPSWRERHMRLEVTRIKPITRVRTVDDILRDVKIVREQLNVVNSKLKTLERLKATAPSELLAEYEKKYTSQVEMLNRSMRRLGLELEPFYEQLKNEAQKLNTEIEKLNIAYKLGEMSEGEYKSSVEPLESRLNGVQKKLDDIEFVLTQLKMPRAKLPKISLPARRIIRRRRKAEEPVGLMYCPYCGNTHLIRTPSGSIICSRCRRTLR